MIAVNPPYLIEEALADSILPGYHPKVVLPIDVRRTAGGTVRELATDALIMRVDWVTILRDSPLT